MSEEDLKTQVRANEKEIISMKFDLVRKDEHIKDLKEENNKLYAVLEKYVLVSRFAPIEKAVYGMIGLILISVLVALLSNIIQ